MAISVSLKVIDGIAFAPGDLSWGEAQSVGVDIDNGGTILQASFARPSLQGNARGIKADVVSGYFSQSTANRVNLILGQNPSTQSIDVSGRSISGFISKVEPSGSITISSIEIVESCRLTWESTEFE